MYFTEREQSDSSTGKHPGPIERPDKDYGSVAVRHDLMQNEERAGTSERDQRPVCSSDDGHEKAVGLQGPSSTNTISSFETAPGERAGSTEGQQHREYAPSTLSGHEQEKAAGIKGPGETKTFSGSEAPDEERVGLQKSDKRTECTPPTSCNEGNEKTVEASVAKTTRETTGDHMTSGGVVPSTTPPPEGQGEPVTNEVLRGGNAASESTVPASSTSNITTDGNTAETVRSTAVLEGSEIPNNSDLRDTDSVEQNTTPDKSDGCHTVPDDQHQQVGKDSVTEERNTTESGENPAPTVSTTATFTEPQQRAPEKENLLGSSSKLEDEKEFTQVRDVPQAIFTHSDSQCEDPKQ